MSTAILEWEFETDPEILEIDQASEEFVSEHSGYSFRVRRWNNGPRTGAITLRIIHDRWDDPGWYDTVNYDTIKEAMEAAQDTLDDMLKIDNQ
jgi:hypothetical protein